MSNSQSRAHKPQRGIHWGAMGSGLIVAALLLDPEQKTLLLAMGCSSLIVSLLNRQRSPSQSAS